MTTMLRILTIVCLALGLAGMRVLPAHAQTTWTVTDCVNQYGTGTAGSPSPGSIQWAVNGANTDNAGDTIRFSCSGTIGLSSTLNITGNMTVDGSGQSVTIDGGNSVRLFSVSSGVSITLTSLTLAHGSAGPGGAIFNDGGTVTVTNSTLTGNNVSFCGVECFPDGGAIYNTGGGTLTVSGSTFSSNSASNGGAIYNDFGTVTVHTSTFSGNSARSAGGAIENAGSNSLVVSDSTFSGNSATYGGAMYDGGTVIDGGDIFASNTGGNCYGATLDEGYNVDTDGSCTSSQTGDTSSDPLLGPLAHNGGSTETMALLPGSPAIDQIPSDTTFMLNGTPFTLCPAMGTDQRGFPRPDQNEQVCDIGAYEYQDPYPLPTGETAYDIESSNWSCSGGGTSCITAANASDCVTTTPCPTASYGDVEAFGPPNNATFGTPDELILACVQGTDTGYQIGYLDVVSHQGALDYPAGTRSYPGVYGTADSGTISGKGTLIGGGGSEDNPSQPSSVSASAYDSTTGIVGSVSGIQNTDNREGANTLNSGGFRVTIRGRVWTVNTTGTTPVTTRNTTSSTMSCTVGGSHANDLRNAGIDTDALAEGELEPSLGDNQFLLGLVNYRR